MDRLSDSHSPAGEGLALSFEKFGVQARDSAEQAKIIAGAQLTQADNQIILAHLQRKAGLQPPLELGQLSFSDASSKRPETSERLSPYAGILDGAFFIARHREQVDYSKIWPKDIPVLFVGERHISLSDKQEIIDHLVDLRDKQGLTHVGMEMLQESDQKLVNRYLAGEEPRERIIKLFDSWDRGNGQPEKLMEMVDAIKTAKLKVLALDLDYLDPNQQPSDFFEKRNENWARVVNQTLNDTPQARILVYCGVDHSTYIEGHEDLPVNLQRYFSRGEKTANQILSSNYQRKSVVVSFAGAVKDAGMDKEHSLSMNHFWNVVSVASIFAQTDQERFAIPIEPASPRSADYIIHLPQTEVTGSWY